MARFAVGGNDAGSPLGSCGISELGVCWNQTMRGRGVTDMSKDGAIRVSLCQADKCCPEVVIDAGEGEVRIGEPGNLVVLSKKYWNDLVAKIQAGQLRQI